MSENGVIATWAEDDRLFRLLILPDNDPEDPRENDNLGTIACWQGRYALGDIQPKEQPNEHLDGLPEGTVILPVHMYDHSGVTINTTGFSCPWDSGQVGVIYATPEAIKASGLKVTRGLIEEYLRQEIATYDQYLRGDVWGYQIESRASSEDEWEIEDSCWDFYGSDPLKNGMIYHLSESAAKAVREA